MTDAATRTLVRWGRAYGGDLKLVQAAGGNISVKTGPARMVIKSSGVRLDELSDHNGWAVGDPHAIRRGLSRIARQRSREAREMAYAALLGRASQTRRRRVSMETGFHAILQDRYVMHLHSLAGILLGMMPPARAKAAIRRIWKDPVDVRFVPATIPGFELVHRMMTYRAPSSAAPVTLWIQRNHGVVWSSFDGEALRRDASLFEHRLRRFFGLDRYTLPHDPGSRGCRYKTRAPAVAAPGRVERSLCFCHWSKWSVTLAPLFPDFVIYFECARGEGSDIAIAGRRVRLSARTSRQWRDKKEVFYAHAVVSTVARSRGWLKRLPAFIARTLKTMETERLRRLEILKA